MKILSYDTSVDTRSFYIHWPFCPYRCHFCPFLALAGQDEFMQDYHKALINEIKYYLSSCQQKTLETLYFGGGTPSTYPKELLLDTFDTLRKDRLLSTETEVTIEVNPGTVDDEKLLLWKELGINRLSIGVQSLNSEVLKRLNRHQSNFDVLSLLDKASKLFANVSIDLILGLPSISNIEWQEIIKTIVQWPIKHVSTYFLTVHENTRLYFGVKNRQIVLPNEDEIVDLYLWTIDYLRRFGLLQYETSSFAKEGFECKHNQVYWSYKPYKAFGLGACSFDGKVRYQNEKNLMQYLQKSLSNENLSIFTEELTPEQIHLEKIMLGMRQMNKGVSINELVFNASEEKKEQFLSYIALLNNRGIINIKNGNIFLTTRGLSVENEIVVNLSNFS